MNFNNLALHLSFASLVILAFATFTSLSISAGAHIFIVVPGIYFFFKHFKQKRQLPWSAKVLFLLFVTVIASVLVNTAIIEHPVRNILKGKYFLFALFFLVSFKEVFKNYMNEKRIRILLWLFLIATTLASLSGIIGLYTGFNPIKFKAACHPTRACGVYGMYMTYGYGISLFMVLLSGALLYRDKFQNYVPTWLLGAAFVINLAGLHLSYARGGLLGFLVALPFFFIKKNIKLFFGVMIAGVLVLGGTMLASESVRDMFFKRGHSNDQRLAFYEAAYRAWSEKPILGWGFRNFEPNTVKIKEKYNIAHTTYGGHAHNNLLEHLASTGIIGFVLVGFFHLFWLLEMWQRDDWIGDMILPFVVSFTVAGLFQYTFGDGENLFLITAIYALSLIPPAKGESFVQRSPDTV
ncbi:MAG: O-antigen ligase family protein [Deltaproteobacteria bacterium]|nr:MAG: O-antigen ligase family protein [Deltaproteobacteria bacterium]